MNTHKIAAYMGLAWLLAGCNPLMTASLDTFKAAVGGPAPLELTQAQVDAVPFAQIKVTTVSSEGVMALIRQRGDLQFWVASGKQVLLVRNGLVVRTVGLGVDLNGTHWQDQSPFQQGLHRVPDGYRSTRQIDGVDGYRMGITLTSRMTRKGIETVEILGKPYALLRVDEDVEASGFQARNRYWVDPVDGFIVQSEQHLTPDLTLTITQLQPTRKDAR
ncbi:YjbF family lipoprotein [Pseudomonas extremorientalis]|uniref:YjbF family lipoprotein n=1 Tax=Pseudomonas extremorientalis TaxID=169669 RepID=UPI0027BA8956|nr:YjbF family lipoprotein [Pseudomonas extremorientalis]